MDIYSKGKYPANKLSNFSPNHFTFDGVECFSIEGVLQAFKFKNPEVQKEVCKLVGLAAKSRGSRKRWQERQELYWLGVVYERDSKEYQKLLTRLYDACFDQCEGFRKALKATGNATLTHSIGRNKSSETVLTATEFIRQLNRLRDRLDGIEKEKKDDLQDFF